MTQHSKMREINPEYFDHAQEECAELIQVISKIKRFGLYDVFDDKSNLFRLREEVGDLLQTLVFLGLIEHVRPVPGHGAIMMQMERKKKKDRIYGPNGLYMKERQSSAPNSEN